jgi:hypothetical protein
VDESADRDMNGMELRVELARLDERMKAQAREITHSEQAASNALKLAADELARRLDTLNNQHADARVDRERYLESSVHYAYKDMVDGQIKRLELWKENVAGRTLIIGALAGLSAGAAIALLVAALK